MSGKARRKAGLRPNRYDDWARLQRPLGSEQNKRLCPVMIRLKGPEKPSLSGWQLHVDGSFKKLLDLTQKQLDGCFGSNGVVQESLFASGDLLAFRTIVSDAKIEITPEDTIRNILKDNDKRDQLAAFLSKQTEAALDYLMMVQLYLPEELAHDENGSLKDLGEVLFIGQPLDEGLPTLESTAQIPETVIKGDATVMLGIIDGGFPFAHDDLRYGPNKEKTRIERLWVQLRDTLLVSKKFGMSNGVTLTRENIEELLNDHDDETIIYTSELRDKLKIETGSFAAINTSKGRYQPLMNQASHGMHVLGTALDSFKAAGGNLDKAKICLVELPVEVTTDTSGSLLGAYYVQAVRQLMQWADEAELPLVINMSYGMTAGPKNAKHPAEIVIERLVNARSAYLREKLSNGDQPTRLPNTTVVLPSGNSRLNDTATTVTLQPDLEYEETWIILPDDSTSSFLEIWIEGGSGECVSLTVEPPSPLKPFTTDLDKDDGHRCYLGKRKDPIVAVYANKTGLFGENNNAGHSFFVAVAPTKRLDEEDRSVAAPGRWKLKIKNSGSRPIRVATTAQRDDTPLGFPLRGRQSFFEIDTWEQVENELGSGTYPARVSSRSVESILGGVKAARVVNAEDGNAIASSKQVLSVGALVNVYGGDDHVFEERLVPSIYSSNTMRGFGDPAPDRLAPVDRGYFSLGKLGNGTLSGTKVHLTGTSIAAPQIAGQIAAEYSQSRR